MRVLVHIRKPMSLVISDNPVDDAPIWMHNRLDGSIHPALNTADPNITYDSYKQAFDLLKEVAKPDLYNSSYRASCLTLLTLNSGLRFIKTPKTRNKHSSEPLKATMLSLSAMGVLHWTSVHNILGMTFCLCNKESWPSTSFKVPKDSEASCIRVLVVLATTAKAFKRGSNCSLKSHTIFLSSVEA